jgi:hypothetical protein
MFEDLRRPLDERGVPAQAVQLPGDDTQPLEGALALVPADGGFDLVTIDYGQPVRLGHADDEAAAAALLLAYLDRPLPALRPIASDEFRDLAASTSAQSDELRPRLTDGSLLIQLPAGLALDRIGALDGVMLFPAETPFEARSLPPTALAGAELHRFVTAADVLVRVQVVAPWFGQPGGGIRFTLADDFTGIRDLVVAGALERVAVA